jgi:hypothetical protein
MCEVLLFLCCDRVDGEERVGQRGPTWARCRVSSFRASSSSSLGAHACGARGSQPQAVLDARRPEARWAGQRKANGAPKWRWALMTLATLATGWRGGARTRDAGGRGSSGRRQAGNPAQAQPVMSSSSYRPPRRRASRHRSVAQHHTERSIPAATGERRASSLDGARPSLSLIPQRPSMCRHCTALRQALASCPPGPALPHGTRRSSPCPRRRAEPASAERSGSASAQFWASSSHSG